jgi:N-acyl-D-aspartate/D-glutamate deacylase
MQKSTRDGSQGGPCVNVTVGVMDGIVVAVGDGDVDAATTFVFTTTGVSITWGVAQDTRSNSRR